MARISRTEATDEDNEVASRKVAHLNSTPELDILSTNEPRLSKKRKRTEVVSHPSDTLEERRRQTVSPSSPIQNLQMTAKVDPLAATPPSINKEKKRTGDKTRRKKKSTKVKQSAVSPSSINEVDQTQSSSFEPSCFDRSSAGVIRHRRRSSSTNGSRNVRDNSAELMCPKSKSSRKESFPNNYNSTRRSSFAKDDGGRTAGSGDSTDDLEIVYERIIPTSNTEDSCPSQQSASEIAPSQEECFESADDESGRRRKRSLLRKQSKLGRSMTKTSLLSDKSASSSPPAKPDDCPGSDTICPHQEAASQSETSSADHASGSKRAKKRHRKVSRSPKEQLPDQSATEEVDRIWSQLERMAEAGTFKFGVLSTKHSRKRKAREIISETTSVSEKRRKRASPDVSPHSPKKKRRTVHRKASSPAKEQHNVESVLKEVDIIYRQLEEKEAINLQLFSPPSKWEHLVIPEGANVQAIKVKTKSGSKENAEKHYYVDDSQGDQLFNDMISFTDHEWTNLMTSVQDHLPERESDWMKVADQVGRTTEACRSAFRWAKEHYASTIGREDDEDMY